MDRHVRYEGELEWSMRMSLCDWWSGLECEWREATPHSRDAARRREHGKAAETRSEHSRMKGV